MPTTKAPVSNPFERAARAEKVFHLVETLDTIAVSIDVDPHRHAADVCELLERFSPHQWRLLAAITNDHPPSHFAQLQVRLVYWRRAAERLKAAG